MVMATAQHRPDPFFGWGKSFEEAVSGSLGEGVSVIPLADTTGWSAGSLGFVGKSDDTGNQFLGPAISVITNVSVTFGFETDSDKGAGATLWQPTAGQFAAMSDEFSESVEIIPDVGDQVRIADGGPTAVSSLGVRDPIKTLQIATLGKTTDVAAMKVFFLLRRSGQVTFAFWDEETESQACYIVFRMTSRLESSTGRLAQNKAFTFNLVAVSEDGFVE